MTETATLSSRIVAAHLADPGLNSPALASRFGCHPAYVRVALKRNGTPMGRMTPSDTVLMQVLQRVADAKFDGHLSILKFTTNWRVGFETPNDRTDIEHMAAGKTLAEAARNALEAVGVLFRTQPLPP